jgi:hypothetical protein
VDHGRSRPRGRLRYHHRCRRCHDADRQGQGEQVGELHWSFLQGCDLVG